jgi:hypothetical protein
MNCSAIDGKDGAGEASVIHNFRTGYESTNDELQRTANFEFLINDSVRKPMAAISIFPLKQIHHLAAPTIQKSFLFALCAFAVKKRNRNTMRMRGA